LFSRIPIDIDCLEELGIHSNISIASINLDFKHVASHLDDLRHASYKISELEKDIREQEWKNHQTSKHTAYSAMVYILFSVGIMCTLYEMYRYLRSRFTRARGIMAVTTPLGEVQASTRTNGSGNTVNINIKTSNESLSIDPGEIPLHNLQHLIEEDTRPCRTLRPRSAKSYF
jgi:hypothetical protein